MNYKEHHVILKSSYLVREPGPRFILHGVHGSFIKYGIDPQEQALKDGARPGSPGWGMEPIEDWGILNTELNSLHYKGKLETLQGNYLEFYDAVFESIRNGSNPPVTAEQALGVIKIIESVMKSSEQGKTVYLKD
jgi:predicted dehydrogenase